MGFRTRLRVPICIEEIYVPLRAMLDLRATGPACFADAEDAEQKLGHGGECDDIALPEAFSRAKALDRRGIVILGDPGSGKTTHLKRLLLWCLRQGPDQIDLPTDIIPVFLPLRELTQLDQGLDAFFQTQLDKPHLGTPQGFGKALAARGKLLFLLDGLDEVADPDQRGRVARWIDAALTVHRNCWFVVTCRFAGYTDQARLCEQFLEMHMRPLSFSQVETFVRNWYRIVENGLLTGWDQEHYGFMHLGFQEYLAARHIQNNFYLDHKIINDLADRFGQSWWQEVTLLLLSLENPCLFIPFMCELVQRPGFTQHPDLVEMCLDDAAEKPVLPFIELLQAEPVDDPDLWQRQLACLKLVERLDNDALDDLIDRLARHPYDKIREQVGQRTAKAGQEVIVGPRGGYELVRIPGGGFLMGSPDSEEGRWNNEGPQHLVRVQDFYIGRYPVTNEQYGRFLAKNPKTREPAYWADRELNQPQQPVVGVSWDDARQYARWAGLQLPSEAQWEYACRAGTSTRFFSGDSEQDLDRAGWYEKNSGSKLQAVGQKEPNKFGLYDMHGNVLEWVEDDWHDNYKGAPDNGEAWIDEPKRGQGRVFRGGAWYAPAGDCRSAHRFRNEPGFRFIVLGFRLALLPGQPG